MPVRPLIFLISAGIGRLSTSGAAFEAVWAIREAKQPMNSTNFCLEFDQNITA